MDSFIISPSIVRVLTIERLPPVVKGLLASPDFRKRWSRFSEQQTRQLSPIAPVGIVSIIFKQNQGMIKCELAGLICFKRLRFRTIPVLEKQRNDPK